MQTPLVQYDIDDFIDRNRKTSVVFCTRASTDPRRFGMARSIMDHIMKAEEKKRAIKVSTIISKVLILCFELTHLSIGPFKRFAKETAAKTAQWMQQCGTLGKYEDLEGHEDITYAREDEPSWLKVLNLNQEMVCAFKFKLYIIALRHY